jgi:16S rRNA processing protein RimM
MLDYENVLLGKSGVWRTESVETGRATARGVQFKLLGVDDRDSASLLVGADVAVPRSALPPVEPGRYYLHDLEGLEVVTPTGELLGDVTHFLQSPAHPVMVVRREQKEHLIPVVAERLLAVDLQQGRITVDWQADW